MLTNENHKLNKIGSIPFLQKWDAPNKNQLPYQGLTSEEVKLNRKRYGANVLTPPERDPLWKLFLAKFEDPVILILMMAAAIAITVGILEGEYAEGLGIVVAILLATTLAFVNEYKANQEFNILNQVYDEVAIKVIRDGNFTTIPRKESVVGDITYLEQGEEVPADGEVLEEVSLEIEVLPIPLCKIGLKILKSFTL